MLGRHDAGYARAFQRSDSTFERVQENLEVNLIESLKEYLGDGERLVRPKYVSTTKQGEIPTTYGVSTGEDCRPSRRKIFLPHNRSSCAAEQFHSDASLEALNRRAPNNSKNWQWTTEGEVSAHLSRHACGYLSAGYCTLTHVAKTVRDFCSRHMQLPSWPAYSPYMSHIEHVWDSVGQRLTRYLRAAASKNEICCSYKQYGIIFHKQTFKICLTPCHVV
ncbi:uncharacterized protein TNCV_97511 [Trichonephila clavipes]|nr:uncharacterized protein TNCV_97511 [Trichonephila clavipes]